MGFENEMQTSRKYKGYEIRKIQAFDGKNDLFLCLVNNVLSMSLHEALIEEEIAQITDYNWLSTNESRRFRSVYAQGGVKLYANMLVFAQFVNSFLGDELSILKDLSAGVSQSVGSLTIDTVGLSFKGVTLIDSINSFADALRNTRPVSTNAYNCISDEAALVLEVGYDSQLTLFAHWFDNTKHERKQLLDAPEWRAIRKLLGDSVVAKMLLNYGTGFSLVKFRPTNTLKTNDVMLVLPVDTAHGQLKMFQMLQGFFGQMNPDRPQVIEHHGFLVAPLYPRDFVSAFSGELLGQFGNAYYTNIGSHLLISNTAEVLIESIDAYLQGRVLANDPVFMSGRRNFPEQTNLAIWLLTPRYFNSLYYYSNQQTRVDLLKYKTIVNQAEFMGLHSYQKDGVMHTQFELLLSKPEFLPKGKDFAVPSVDSL
jgi:hypothetical protein